jgi:hypothetical protein
MASMGNTNKYSDTVLINKMQPVQAADLSAFSLQLQKSVNMQDA